MPSQREAILAHIDGLLGTIPGATATRSREVAIKRTDGPAILLRPEDEQISRQTTGLAVRDLVVVVAVVTRGSVPDTAADPFLAAIVAKLMADPTLGGKAASIMEESTRFDFEVAEQTALEAAMRFTIRYMTPAGSLAAQA